MKTLQKLEVFVYLDPFHGTKPQDIGFLAGCYTKLINWVSLKLCLDQHLKQTCSHVMTFEIIQKHPTTPKMVLLQSFSSTVIGWIETPFEI